MVAREAHTGLTSPESTEGSWDQWEVGERKKGRKEERGRQAKEKLEAEMRMKCSDPKNAEYGHNCQGLGPAGLGLILSKP